MSLSALSKPNFAHERGEAVAERPLCGQHWRAEGHVALVAVRDPRGPIVTGHVSKNIARQTTNLGQLFGHVNQ
jgi:hypothetical protein